MFVTVNRIMLGKAFDAFRRKNGAALAARVMQKVTGSNSLARISPEDRESLYHVLTNSRALAQLNMES